MADLNVADILDANRDAVIAADDDVADVARYRAPDRYRVRSRTARLGNKIRRRHLSYSRLRAFTTWGTVR